MRVLKFSTAGESHGKGIFAILENFPAGFRVDVDFINCELARRQGGYGRGGRMRIEKDRVEILSGVRCGLTIGSPILMAIWNKDFENWKNIMSPECDGVPEDVKITRPRPGHADLAGVIKYGFDDIRNVLERSSARETAGRVAAGALCKTMLMEFGIKVGSYVTSIGSAQITGFEQFSFDERFGFAENSEVRIPVPFKEVEDKVKGEIDAAMANGESLGGVFEIFATGVPVGLGSYVQWDRRLDGRIAFAMMSIQGIKGVEIGEGFSCARLPGSQVHDEIFYSEDRGFYRKTNRAGGIEGGISNGEPIVVRCAMKPIPTLKNPLKSVDIRTKEPFSACVERSDVCAVPAAAVVAEAMLSMVLLDALLERYAGDSFNDLKRHIFNSG